ncbi:MAG: type II secretion system protein [Parachlamydiales bacterium]|nr:type II secretion system protein [Parachlamydiales bacterium]
MRKKRYVTLLEIMIVILLIGIISSVVGYNMKGSLDKGKAFKTEQAQRQLRDILLLSVAEGEDIEEVVRRPFDYLEKSGLAKDTKSLLVDGWNKPFDLKVKDNKTDIEVKSKNLEKYYSKKGVQKEKSSDNEEYYY